MTRLLPLILLMLATTAVARNPHHPSPTRAERKAVPRTSPPAVVVSDTVRGTTADSVVVAGFEKAQKSSRESMMVTNGTGSAFSSVCLEITYKDMQGRMLHKAVHDVAEIIPAGETRMVSVPSFDRQNLFYYRLSPMQPRARQATPFDVEVKVIYVCYPKLTEQ